METLLSLVYPKSERRRKVAVEILNALKAKGTVYRFDVTTFLTEFSEKDLIKMCELREIWKRLKRSRLIEYDTATRCWSISKQLITGFENFLLKGELK